MLDVLCFLQHRLDNGSLQSTLKDNVASIALFHSPVDDQSIVSYALVVRFLRGGKEIPTFGEAMGPRVGTESALSSPVQALGIHCYEGVLSRLLCFLPLLCLSIEVICSSLWTAVVNLA